MANDRTTIIIDADASGVAEGVRKADQSLGKLNASVDNQNKSLNRYGEKLGKAFGPGEGLHGRLSELETPLRDSEGAFARAQMAALEFGNKGATAADKVGAGFLLVSDSIAAFASGGVVGIAIAAAVTGFSLLTNEINKQEQASKEAEEATKKQAEALQNLAKSANAANVTISLLNAQNREKEVRERVRFIDEERQDVKARYLRLRKLYDANEEEFNKLRVGSRKRELKALTETQSAELDKLKKQFDTLNDEYSFSDEKIRKARADVEKEMRENSQNEITLLVKDLDAKIEASTKAVAKKTASARKAATGDFGTGAALARLDQERMAIDSSVAESLDKNRELLTQYRREEQQEKFEAFQAEMTQQERLRQFSVDTARQRQEAFMKANAVQIAAVNAVVNGLQQMAHDGEISFAKLADAAATAAGNELVASGTKHLLEGAATALGGLARSNPIAVSAGTAESLKGAAMITAGIGLGAVGGSIGRGAGSASTPASTPTDTRESRAASGSSGGEGGTTIINFNGPAFDKRGVANVITSGQRMAKHRRIAGA